MQVQYDYYKILQVHNLAEPEIIESAYKRLVKKYHPDVNPSSTSLEMIQMINEAYSILGNAEKRFNYNKEWERIVHKPERSEKSDNQDENIHRGNEKMFMTAKSVLDDYFRNIMKQNFAYCYELISNLDKKNISKEEFINWQEAVSKIYQIKKYNCEIYGVYRDKLLNGKMLKDVLEFNMNTHEYNIVMDMVQKDHFTKMIILDEGEWRMYLGYEKLEPIISKFNDLKGLLNAKSMMNELMEQHIKVDIPTGLLNQRGILESIEREIHRFDRYGNVFSLVMCEFDLVRLLNTKEEKEVVDSMIKLVGELLTSRLRKLDIIGRWSDKSILIILPETGLLPAIKVSHKMKRMMKERHLIFEDKNYKMVMDFGITEYSSSLEEALDRIYCQIR